MDSSLRGVLFLLLVLLALLTSQISVAYCVFGLLGAGWVVLAARERRAFTLASPLTGLAALFVVLTLASAVFSEDPTRSLKPLPGLSLFLLLPMTMDLAENVSKARAVLLSVAANGTALAVLGYWQYARGGADIGNRIRGTLSHYMTFSGLMIVSGCLLLGVLLEDRGKRRWLGLLCALPFAALLFSFTRNAYVGTLAAVLAYLGLRRPRGLLVLLPILALVFLLVPAQIRGRIASIADPADETNRDRVAMARAGVRMIGDHPVFGLGPEMVKPYYILYRDEDAPRWRVPHLHNNFLQIAAAHGLFAAATYLAMLALFFARTVVLLRREQDPARRALWAGAFLAVAALSVAGLFEYNFGDTEVLIATLLVMGVPFSGAGVSSAPSLSGEESPPALESLR